MLTGEMAISKPNAGVLGQVASREKLRSDNEHLCYVLELLDTVSNFCVLIMCPDKICGA